MKLTVDKKRRPMPFKTLIRVPLVCLGAGAVNYAASLIAASLAQAGRIPEESAFLVGAVAAVIVFLLSGLLFLRKLRQDEIIRSAGYVVLYYFVMFIIEQELVFRAQALPGWLYVPVWPFTYLNTGLLKVGFPKMFALAPAFLSPLFYAMFGLPRETEQKEGVLPVQENNPEPQEEPQDQSKMEG